VNSALEAICVAVKGGKTATAAAFIRAGHNDARKDDVYVPVPLPQVLHRREPGFPGSRLDSIVAPSGARFCPPQTGISGAGRRE
jgi:hypothetical protein